MECPTLTALSIRESSFVIENEILDFSPPNPVVLGFGL